MKKHSFYDLKTGLLTGCAFSTNLADPKAHEQALEMNTPEGHSSVEGVYDHLAHRVDLTSGKIVDHQPPAPSADHAWNAQLKRWRLKPEIAAAAAAVSQANAAFTARLSELEGEERSLMRKFVLGKLDDAGRERLMIIDTELDLLLNVLLQSSSQAANIRC